MMKVIKHVDAQYEDMTVGTFSLLYMIHMNDAEILFQKKIREA